MQSLRDKCRVRATHQFCRVRATHQFCRVRETHQSVCRVRGTHHFCRVRATHQSVVRVRGLVVRVQEEQRVRSTEQARSPLDPRLWCVSRTLPISRPSTLYAKGVKLYSPGQRPGKTAQSNIPKGPTDRHPAPRPAPPGPVFLRAGVGVMARRFWLRPVGPFVLPTRRRTQGVALGCRVWPLQGRARFPSTPVGLFTARDRKERKER